MTTSATTRAARFDRANRQLAVQDIPVPEIEPGEALVRVEAAGICASDLHMIDGILPDFPPDHVTPGHETADTIARVGPAVPLGRPAQRVVRMAGEAVASAAIASGALAAGRASIRWSWGKTTMTAGSGMLSPMASGHLDLSPSVSHVVSLEGVARGVDRLRTKQGDPAPSSSTRN